MAEIKSTLDIIMEKTKDLSLSPEEKEAIKRKEIAGKLKGLWAKYMDGLMDFNTFRSEVNLLTKDDQAIVEDALVKGALDRIDPEKDNHMCLDILEQVARVDISGIQSLIAEFHRDLYVKMDARKKELIKQINKKGI